MSESEPFDLDKLLANLKARYLGDKRFREAFQLGYNFGQFFQMPVAASPSVPFPSFSSDEMADRLASLPVLDALTRTHPVIRQRQRVAIAGFPTTKERRDKVKELLTKEVLTSREVTAAVRKTFDVPFYRGKDGTDRLSSLVTGDIYAMRKNKALEITGEERNRRYRYNGGTVNWRINK